MVSYSVLFYHTDGAHPDGTRLKPGDPNTYTDERTGITYPIFINPYYSEGDPDIYIEKEVVGTAWPAGEVFEFEIKKASEDEHEGDIPMPEKTKQSVSSVGRITFGHIKYDLDHLTKKDGNGLSYDDFIYDFYELPPTGSNVVEVGNGIYRKNGINYDTNPYKIHIHAHDNGKGEIISTIYVNDEKIDSGLTVGMVFKIANPYGWDPIEDEIIIYKATIGKPDELIMPFDFTIELLESPYTSTPDEATGDSTVPVIQDDSTKAPMPERIIATANVVENGKYYPASFGKLNITREGHYKYRITEKLKKDKAGDLLGWDIVEYASKGWKKLDEQCTDEFDVYYYEVEFDVDAEPSNSGNSSLKIRDPNKLVVPYIVNEYIPKDVQLEEPVPFVKKTVGLPKGTTITFNYRLTALGNTAGLVYNPMPHPDDETEWSESVQEVYGSVTVTQNNQIDEIDLGRMIFTVPGDYYYEIEEIDLPGKWVALPAQKQKFTVHITGDEEGNLDPIYDQIVFTNYYDHSGEEFVFKKIWTGYPGDPPAFSWTLYRDGEVADPQHQFIIDEDGNYHAYDMRYGDYYLIENVPQDFQAVYHNIGQYADITDRLYSGGVLENVYLPDTGDRDNPVKWMMLFGGSVLAIVLLVIVTKRKQKTGKK